MSLNGYDLMNHTHLGDRGSVRVERTDSNLRGDRAEGGRDQPRGRQEPQPFRQHPRSDPRAAARAKFMKMKIWAKLPCLHFACTVVRLMDSLNLSMKRHFNACYTCVRQK